MSSLVVAGAVRAFGALRALDGVSLTLTSGRIVGLLGPNGAGKSTLIRAICGRVRLDHGTVLLDDVDPRRVSAARRHLGLVPQDIALYPELTARENLEVLGGLAGLDAVAARAAAQAALVWSSLASRAHEGVGTLSGGMRRRLNLAAATLHDPAILLLDEPTVGIDPPAREEVHRLLLDLRARGKGLLLATHDLQQATELCDTIAILVDGRIHAEGSLAELIGGAAAGKRAPDLRDVFFQVAGRELAT